MKKKIVLALLFLPNVSLAAAKSVDSVEVNFISIIITFALMYFMTFVLYWIVLYVMKKFDKKFNWTKLFIPVLIAVAVGFLAIVLSFALLDWASVSSLMILATMALVGLSNFLVGKYYLKVLDKNQDWILGILAAIFANPIVWLVVINYMR